MIPMEEIDKLIELAMEGDKSSIARLISMVERAEEASGAIAEKIYPHTGNAFYIGVTGPPGAGKSTIVNKLVEQFCDNDFSVGVIAVDPSSPYTGGALLGDRVRMKCKNAGRNCFFRSMSAGSVMGGIGKKTKEASWIFDACGMQVVIIETVGVGQSECDIMMASDTVVVVLTPEAGDSIQMMKAGLLEIADIFVINKSDRGGAEEIFLAVEGMLDRKEQISGKLAWRPPILKTTADRNIGMIELYEKIGFHHQNSTASPMQAQRRQLQYTNEFLNGIKEQLAEKIMKNLFQGDTFSDLSRKFHRQKVHPGSVSKKIVERILPDEWIKPIKLMDDL